jgi:hypothetical protein
MRKMMGKDDNYVPIFDFLTAAIREITNIARYEKNPQLILELRELQMDLMTLKDKYMQRILNEIYKEMKNSTFYGE